MWTDVKMLIVPERGVATLLRNDWIIGYNRS